MPPNTGSAEKNIPVDFFCEAAIVNTLSSDLPTLQIHKIEMLSHGSKKQHCLLSWCRMQQELWVPSDRGHHARNYEELESP
jgi:hypothetical protein